MKKFNKNIAKEFKTGFGRFIAIMVIIAIGVGFLIGILQATPEQGFGHYCQGYVRADAGGCG